MKYENITIEEAEYISNTLQCDIVCDADKKQNISENIRDGLLNAFNKLVEVVEVMAKTIRQAFNSIKEYIIKLFDKKISKKRFIKLLQSNGLQRNDINRMIKNNKDKYTMWRYFINSPPYP